MGSVFGFFDFKLTLQMLALFFLSLQVKLKLMQLSHLVRDYLQVITAACIWTALHTCLALSSCSSTLAADWSTKASSSWTSCSHSWQGRSVYEQSVVCWQVLGTVTIAV